MFLRIVLSASVLVLIGACNSRATCNLPAQLQNQAGQGATDCGHASADDRTDVDQCVAAAYGQELPFFAQYDLPGEGSKLTLGISRDATGEVTIFQLDENPSGGSTKSNEVIDTYACGEPALDVSAPREPPNVTPVVCKTITAIGPACG